jgi:hypothetical protein
MGALLKKIIKVVHLFQGDGHFDSFNKEIKWMLRKLQLGFLNLNYKVW